MKCIQNEKRLKMSSLAKQMAGYFTVYVVHFFVRMKLIEKKIRNPET